LFRDGFLVVFAYFLVVLLFLSLLVSFAVPDDALRRCTVESGDGFLKVTIPVYYYTGPIWRGRILNLSLELYSPTGSLDDLPAYFMKVVERECNLALCPYNGIVVPLLRYRFAGPRK
jgi:hypothetical protein